MVHAQQYPGMTHENIALVAPLTAILGATSQLRTLEPYRLRAARCSTVCLEAWDSRRSPVVAVRFPEQTCVSEGIMPGQLPVMPVIHHVIEPTALHALKRKCT